LVPALSIAFMVVSLLISVLVPAGLIIWIMRRHRTGFAPVAVGFLVFFVLQFIFRMQLINILQLLPGVQAFIAENTLLYIALLSLTAGIVEEFGRLFGFSVMLKRRRELRHGVAYGIGHGGIEAVLVVGITYVSNLVLVSMMNGGGMDMLSSMAPSAAAQLQAASAALADTPSHMFLLAGFERIFAIALHLGLSVLVLYGVRKRKIGYTLLAVLLHGAVNFGAVTFAQYVSIWVSEGLMLAIAILSIVFVLKMRKPFAALNAQQASAPPGAETPMQ